jgi:ketosteroid isomerase-like protein
MSQENVELTLRALDAWNRRDVDAWIGLWDPEGVYEPAFEWIADGRTYRGHAEIRQEFEDQAEFAEEAHAEFFEVRDLGEQVLALGHFRMKFASGVELDTESGVLCTWRNGRCVEAHAWLSHTEALEAAGLRE